MPHTPDIGLLRLTEPGACAQVVALVNAAFLATEGPLWVPGAERTSEAEVAGVAAAGQLHGILGDTGAPLGVVRLEIRGTRAELGMLAVAPQAEGRGLGTALVRYAEAQASAAGADLMRLTVARPRDGALASKEKLGAWYPRLGYTRTDTVPLPELYPHLVVWFAVPTVFDVYERTLSPHGG